MPRKLSLTPPLFPDITAQTYVKLRRDHADQPQIGPRSIAENFSAERPWNHSAPQLLGTNWQKPLQMFLRGQLPVYEEYHDRIRRTAVDKEVQWRVEHRHQQLDVEAAIYAMRQLLAAPDVQEMYFRSVRHNAQLQTELLKRHGYAAQKNTQLMAEWTDKVIAEAMRFQRDRFTGVQIETASTRAHIENMSARARFFEKVLHHQLQSGDQALITQARQWIQRAIAGITIFKMQMSAAGMTGVANQTNLLAVGNALSSANLSAAKVSIEGPKASVIDNHSATIAADITSKHDLASGRSAYRAAVGSSDVDTMMHASTPKAKAG